MVLGVEYMTVVPYEAVAIDDEKTDAEGVAVASHGVHRNSVRLKR